MEYKLRVKRHSVEVSDPSIKATRIFKDIKTARQFINANS